MGKDALKQSESDKEHTHTKKKIWKRFLCAKEARATVGDRRGEGLVRTLSMGLGKCRKAVEGA